MTVSEVSILGDHDPVLDVGHPGDLRVGRAVLAGEIERVDSVVSRVAQLACEPSR